MTLELVFTAFLLEAQRKRDNAENKPASSLVVLIVKAFGGILPFWRGRQVEEAMQ